MCCLGVYTLDTPLKQTVTILHYINVYLNERVQVTIKDKTKARITKLTQRIQDLNKQDLNKQDFL